MRRLTLTEVDSWTPHNLNAAEQRLLLDSGLVDIRPSGTSGNDFELRASTVVGAASLNGYGTTLDLRIKPKIPVSRLLFLMSYSATHNVWRDDWVELPDALDIPSAIAEVLARSCHSALQAGVLQGYLTVDEAAMTLRGRIRFADQARRHFGQLLPAEITYDEFTTDIAENQILKAAIQRMLRVPGVPALSRRRLHIQLQRLTDVRDLAPGQPIPHWTPSRLNARYVPTLRFAELVLAGSSFDLGLGTVRVNGFMISMHKVFEDFVTKALGEALVSQFGGRCSLQDTGWNLDAQGQIRLRPDLVWYPNLRGGLPGVVVDAKYKAEKISGFPQSDVYQMLAYCTSLGLSEGHLIYAAGNETGAEYAIPMSDRSLRIRAHTLNLESSPQALLSETKRLAMSLKGHS